MPAKKEKQDNTPLEGENPTTEDTQVEDTGVDTTDTGDTDTTTTEDTQVEEEKEDEDVSAAKAKKTSDEVREERKAARVAAKEALSDTINVYASIATQYGPAFVVVGMPRIDVKAFGKKVIFDTKLPLGTRVNNKGKEIEENEEVDRDGNVIENTEE